MAGELAAESGEVPSSADVVLTSRQRSQDAFGGDVVDSDQPVYLVQMQGTFVLNAVPIPYGEEAPTGSALWFLFDPKTGERLDFGVADAPADLSSLGEVSQITPIAPTS